MALRLLPMKEVTTRTSISRSRNYSLIRKGEFPPSVPLGERARAWPEDEIDEWIADRIARARGESRAAAG